MKEMFEKIDKEEDGEVYLREVVDYLDVLDNNVEQSHRVSQLSSWWTQTKTETERETLSRLTDIIDMVVTQIPHHQHQLGLS